MPLTEVTSSCITANIQSKRTTTSSYISLTTSLTTVGVFAGAFTFGTLFALPDTLKNFNSIQTLLAVAFILFSTSLFTAIGVPIVLKREQEDGPPSYTKAKIVVAHLALVSGLLFAGFVVLNVVLIEIGQKRVGIAGITLLCAVATAIFVLWFLDVTDKLEDKEEPVGLAPISRLLRKQARPVIAAEVQYAEPEQ
jgi:hypothetical protein